MSSYSASSAYKKAPFPISVVHDGPPDSFDVVIVFHSAEGLSKTDTAGYPNPYFMANIDDQISFRSTILSKTSTPKWINEEWSVRNVPLDAKLLVHIYNKDDAKIVDDSIGEFEVVNIINYHAPRDGHRIVGPSSRPNGRFHLSIHSTKSSYESEQLSRYTFDGPCRYSRYDSLDIDARIVPNTECVDSIWKIQLRRISFFFPPNDDRRSNQQHKQPREALSNYSILLAAPSFVKLARQRLFERPSKNNENGQLTSADDLWKLVFLDRVTQQIKPRSYNYIIDDSTWQFSEIGRRWLTDSEVKHTRLADSSECVLYAGEFHLRPKFGWNRLNDEWELVFDNASGTYIPNADLLLNLKKMLLFNFPGLNIITYDYKDPRLRESMEQFEIAAQRYKYDTRTTMSARILPHLSPT